MVGQTLEEECLEALQKLPCATSQFCSVRTPRLLHFNSGSSTQVQEYLPDSLDLKSYVLKHFSSSTPESEKCNVLEVGRALGEWLRSFHDWAAAPEQEALRSRVELNKEMQSIKLTYNYESLLRRLERFPFLENSRGVFEKIIAKAKAELAEERQLQFIHGDFWTGKSAVNFSCRFLDALLIHATASCFPMQKSNQVVKSPFL